MWHFKGCSSVYAPPQVRIQGNRFGPHTLIPCIPPTTVGPPQSGTGLPTVRHRAPSRCPQNPASDALPPRSIWTSTHVTSSIKDAPIRASDGDEASSLELRCRPSESRTLELRCRREVWVVQFSNELFSSVLNSSVSIPLSIKGGNRQSLSVQHHSLKCFSCSRANRAHNTSHGGAVAANRKPLGIGAI